MNFELIKREVTTEYGQEIAIEKRYKLNKDQNKNKLWVMQAEDPRYIALNNKMIQAGLWK